MKPIGNENVIIVKAPFLLGLQDKREKHPFSNPK